MAKFLGRVVDAFRRLSEWRLSTKIMVAFFAVSMIAIFFFARQSENHATQTLSDTQSRILTNFATSTSLQVESQVSQYRRDALQVATDTEVIAYMASAPPAQAGKTAALLQRLQPALTADPDFRQLLLLNVQGRVVMSDQATAQGQDFSASGYFADGMKVNDTTPFVSDIILAPDKRAQAMYAALPIRDGSGNVLGLAAVRLTPDHLIAPVLSPDLSSQHLQGYLVSQQGVIMANSANPEFTFKALGAVDSSQAIQLKQHFGLDNISSLGVDDLAAKVLGATQAGFTQAHLVNNQETDVVGWAPVANQRWTVMVSEDNAVFAAAVKDLSTNQFLNAAVLALIIGSLVIFAGRLFETTERESLSDPLTGLANRRFLQEIMLRELRRAQRSNQPVSLIIVDIDHFKRVNDRHGHNVGDEVLGNIANLLLANVRATDFVIRYGGEEFVVLQPETRATDAAAVADKLRGVIADTEVESTVKAGTKLKVTISAGVAAFPVDGASGEEIILKADRALYWAKQNGRNRVGLAHGVEAVGAKSVEAEPDKAVAMESRRRQAG